MAIVAVGATIESYDFFLYGTAAGLVFDSFFFSGLHGPAASSRRFATFAVGFLARPSADCSSVTSATRSVARRC